MSRTVFILLLLLCLQLPSFAAARRAYTHNSEYLRDHISDLISNWNGARLEATSADYATLNLRNGTRPIKFDQKELRKRNGRYLYMNMRVKEKESRYGFLILPDDGGFIRFPVVADGNFHIYNFDLADENGRIRRPESIVFSDSGKSQTIHLLGFSLVGNPSGRPDVRILDVGTVNHELYSGVPNQLYLLLHNTGGKASDNLELESLKLPFRVVESNRFRRKLPAIAPQARKTVLIDITPRTPGSGKLSAEVADKEGLSKFQGTLKAVNPPLIPGGSAPGMPAPAPLPAVCNVAAFYTPRYTTADSWKNIREYTPGRRPVLGYYDVSKPETIDWQIKQLTENGINTLFIDWYEKQGKVVHPEWFDAYRKAQHRKLIRWAVAWDNSSAVNSADEFRRIAALWIAGYFRREGYLHVNGKPVVLIKQPLRLDRNLSGQLGVCLAEARKQAQVAGLPGICFIAGLTPFPNQKNVDHVREIKFLLANGFDFVTDVVHTSAEKPGDVPGVLDVEEVADLNTRMWAQRRRTAASNYIPFVTTGCNDYPLRRDSAEIIENRTPEEFGKLCKSAARFIAVNKAPFFLLGPLHEFDRGAAIEPNAEDGFRYYEALRDEVMTPGTRPPQNYGPTALR